MKHIVLSSILVTVLLSGAGVVLAEDIYPEINCVSSESLNLISGNSRFDCNNPSVPPVPSITAGHNGFTLYIAGVELKQWSKIYIFYADCATAPPCNFAYELQVSVTEHQGNFIIEKQIISDQLQIADEYTVMIYNDPAQAAVDEGVGWSNEAPFTVFNAPPTATNLAVLSNACPALPGMGSASFFWDYDDRELNNEKQFQIQIDSDAAFGSPAVDRSFDELDNPPIFQNQQAVSIIVGGNETDSLLYNTTYYWRVNVCSVDIDPALVGPGGICSGWVQGQNYTTIAHPWPYVDFSSTATSPAVDFTNNSICYDIDGLCNTYLWSFGDTANSNQKNPTHAYAAPGGYNVSLVVTDGEGFQCQAIKPVNAPNEPYDNGNPTWREISPFQFDPTCGPDSCVLKDGGPGTRYYCNVVSNFCEPTQEVGSGTYATHAECVAAYFPACN